MKIRTVEILSDKISEDLAWRKKELTDLKYMIDTKSLSPVRKYLLGRCGIAILYAHWEGFIKKSSLRFLEFINFQCLNHSELSENLLTLIIKNKFQKLANTKKTSSYHQITDFFLNKFNTKSIFPYETAIDTESNLSSKVLKEIIWCLGLEYAPYETNEKFLDERLLAKRNYIAHGEKLMIDIKEYSEIHQRIINLMDVFKTQIENSAITESFKRI
jgi:hypothetical protein